MTMTVTLVLSPISETGSALGYEDIYGDETSVADEGIKAGYVDAAISRVEDLVSKSLVEAEGAPWDGVRIVKSWEWPTWQSQHLGEDAVRVEQLDPKWEDEVASAYEWAWGEVYSEIGHADWWGDVT